MRQLTIRVPRGNMQKVIELAEQYDARNFSWHNIEGDGKKWSQVTVHVSNNEVGPLVADLEPLPETHITLFPHDVFPMAPPRSRIPQEITSVSERSPLEVWLNALQSVGSWKGFLGYAAAAGIVAWLGMFTGSVILLVAAMLISPVAGPAMNFAIGSAAGERTLAGRSLVRYAVALLTAMGAAFVLSEVMAQESATSMMVEVSTVSSVAVLLPLISGGAGALNLVQARNSSLVAGTAVGLLLAASLTPPAALVGMALALGRWGMVANALFVLVLQLVGINLSASIVFRAYGLSDTGVRYERGKEGVFAASLIVSLAVLVSLVAYQFSSSPSLQRSTQAQQAIDVVQRRLQEDERVLLVEANLRFTRPAEEREETLLGVIYVERSEEAVAPSAILARELESDIQHALHEAGYNVTPLIDVTVLEPPGPNR